MKSLKTLTLIAVMASLTNILSFPPFAFPIVLGPFETTIHFSQLPIFIAAILGGPLAGLITGFIGGLYMSFTRIPFIVFGLAILGCSTGLLVKKVPPFFAGVIAWCIQAPYVLVTDYLWFSFFLRQPASVIWSILIPILVKLSIEAFISAFFAHIIVRAIRKSGIIY
jgi:thiamine transporter ThiT